MTTRLADLDEFFSPGLVLTVRGQEYTVPLASAELGVWCRRMAVATGEITHASTAAEMQAAIERIDAVPELPGPALTLPERVLGDVYARMVADEVPDPYVQFCGATAYIWIISDEETAARYWQSGGRPEALRPAGSRAERRARTGGSNTAAATATPSAASTSGTTSRPSRRTGRRRRA
ncbi:hypothetical protein J2S43_007856 [Catenuloplanes nepalensis]|uniref:DUF7426 domain-containing protein n=1 Tax=Catenuloplanes nepalensis TaxID=587533 RepID=A0ABT9N6M3_9ACTN|nr:hypothetical protein [Catenuloplanes nepalensis]MDP9799344.1 hypothetical protein [Catenuloplanes nepalensis]